MHRLSSLSLLVLAGALALSGCADHPAAPAAPAAPALESAGSDAAVRHVVVFKDRSIPADFAARVEELGGSIERAYPAIGAATVLGLGADAAASLVGTVGVTYANPDAEVTLGPEAVEVEGEAATDDGTSGAEAPSSAVLYARQWHLRAIGADRAWAAGALGSSAVTVAILDTGLDYTHLDLAGRVDLARSRSFVPSDDAFLEANFPGAHPVADLNYHGTHVGATVSSNAVRAAGVTSRVTLMGVKVLDRNGSGSISGILAGIMYAADAGADVVNMSLAIELPVEKRYAEGFHEVLNRAVTYATQRGATVVVAAGNENLDLDALGSGYKAFCSAPTVLCVSATGPTAADGVNGPWQDPDARAGYSNYGRSHIHVAAPGGSTGGAVWAACSSFSTPLPVCRTAKSFVLGVRGTSMAAPHAAGLAALMVERHGRRPDVVKEAIQKLSDDLGEAGNDPFYGKGRINVAKALGVK